MCKLNFWPPLDCLLWTSSRRNVLCRLWNANYSKHVNVHCSSGRKPVMCKPWEPFVLGFDSCFQNACIIRVCIMANDFGMLFYHGANIPIHSRLVLSPPRLPISLIVSPIYVNEHVLQLTLYDSFQQFFCQLVLRFLEFKTRPNVFSALKSVLMFLEFKILQSSGYCS